MTVTQRIFAWYRSRICHGASKLLVKIKYILRLMVNHEARDPGDLTVCAFFLVVGNVVLDRVIFIRCLSVVLFLEGR